MWIQRSYFRLPLEEVFLTLLLIEIILLFVYIKRLRELVEFSLLNDIDILGISIRKHLRIVFRHWVSESTIQRGGS